jgi:glutamine synthetase adenylyltransferase
MEVVAEICARVWAEQQERKLQIGATFELQSYYPGPGDASSRRLLEALAVSTPAIHQIATRDDLSPVARKNLFRFLESAFSSSARFEIVTAHPEALKSALWLFDGSDYLSQILIRHPEEIATLSELDLAPARVGSGYLFEQPGAGLSASHDPVLDHLVSWDLPHTEKLAVLRRHYLHRIFEIGASDLLEPRSLYHSLGLTTAIAEDALRCAFGLAGKSSGLAVMALGRLGTGEFDVLSDADILFLCDEDADRVALTKTAERMMHALAAHTREGTVFPVDTRLRPHGREGDLLVTPSQLAAYSEHDAQPWEALSFTKMRFLAGSPRVAERARDAAQALFARHATDPEFPAAITQMRHKLEQEGKSAPSIKTSAGTLYDLDFLLGIMTVRRRIAKPGNLRDRIWECCAAGDLNKADAAALDHAAELFRTTEHAVRLVTGRPDKWLPENDHARHEVERLAARTLGQTAFSAGLEAELEQNAAVVREMYLRVVGAAA